LENSTTSNSKEGKLGMSFNICHIITTIDLGGAEKQLLTLASFQRQSGDHIEVIFLKDNPRLLKEFLDAGVEINTSFSSLSFFQQILRLRKKTKDHKTVFHAHLPRAELLCAFALPKKSFIATRHNAEAFFPKGPRLASILLSRYVLHRASASISISRAVTEYLISSHELSPAQINYVIHYGLQRTKVTTRGSSKEVKKVVQLGTVSRLVPQKNLVLLLESLQILRKSGSFDFRLSIVGIGPDKDELSTVAKKLSIDDAVEWVGQLTETETFYQGLDIFILSSNYEGFGLVLLEAMLQGVPIVARRVSAIPEVLGMKHPGLLDTSTPQEMAGRVKEIITNPNLLSEVLIHQRKQLAEFSIEKTYRLHSVIYAKMINSAPNQ
jgi:glycosyltransferase involved in cell wall biosynthesis